ncbi:hypothetical protein P4J29_28745, partial [Bacillus cereus]|nr:hypothetical protein [Bacillus cereus]
IRVKIGHGDTFFTKLYFAWHLQHKCSLLLQFSLLPMWYNMVNSVCKKEKCLMGIFTALLATSSILLLAWVVGEREKQNQK